jgi:membrane protease YdiL (CAAX protease family)
LRPVLVFLLFFIAALFAGALLAYPLFLITGLFTETQFSSVIMKSTQLCGLVFSLLYLKYSDQLTLENIGLKAGSHQLMPQFGTGFIGGLLLFAGLALALFAFGIYGINTGRDLGLPAIVKLLIGAVLTGLAVALFEETVFRGALLQGLRKQVGMNRAVLTISLIYAATHFIDYPEPVDPASIGWSTAVQLFIPAYLGIFSLQTIDALLALFVLGLLFAFVRIRNRNLFQCIGLHAGVVAGVKLFRYFAEYRPDNTWSFLVSTYDYRLGWLACGWLLFVTIAYFVYLHRK